ncbi:MAG: putative esterase [Bradymonadia bacterium]|jgi:predicted esterase
MKRFVFSLAFAISLAACGNDDVSTVDTDTGVDAPTDDVGTDAAVDVSTDTAEADAEPDIEEVQTPDLRSYTGETCPVLGAGTNDIVSSGADRQVELYLPPDVENAPVVFFWYGAGGSGQTYEWMQPFADAYGVVIVVPRAAANMAFEWPIISTNNPANELVYFDDVIRCVSESLPVDTSRIYTSGFSAGALWSTVLVMHRSDVLASAVIFSGGTGALVQAYETPDVQIPILGMYGGESDVFGGLVNFKDTMTDFMDGLVGDGHLIIACNHDLGHTIPNGGLDWGIEFLLAHQFGDTSSPFDAQLPSYLPGYCNYWGE